MPTYGRRASQRIAAAAEESQQPTPRATRRQSGTSSTRRTRRAAEEREPTPEQPDEEPEEVEESSEEEEDAESNSRLRPAPVLSVSINVKRAADLIPIDEVVRKAAEWARYALACEYQRMPIRGDHVRKEVLVDTKYSRIFNTIFNETQKLLQQTFGYHMVEVRPKGADNAELEKQAEAAIRQASSQANGLRSRKRERDTSPELHDEGRTNTNIWVLRSALPPKITKALVHVSNDLVSTDDGSATRNRRRQDGNSAINWSTANHQGGEMGLLYIILGIILVNGRTVTDFTLLSCLKRLRLPMHEVLPSALRGTGPAPGISSSGTQATQTQARQRAKQGTLDGFLTAMVKQSYLEKQRADVSADGQAKNDSGNATQSRTKRSRATDDENTVWEWRWGNRSEVEIGEQRVASLMADIFLDPSASNDGTGPTEDEDVDAATKAVDRAIFKKRKLSLLDNIASVAGSALIE